MPKSKKKLAARSGTSNVVGPSKPLPLSDLPTLRDSLAFVGLLEEEGRKVDFALMLEVVGEIEKIYARASTSLTLLKKHSIANKLWRARQKQLYFQQSHTHDDKRIAFEKKLDLIFEVLVCQCPMTEDEMGIQIMCSCPLEVKIPKDELPFIFAQRNRSSSLPTLQIGRLDLPKTKIMKKKEERKQHEMARLQEHTQQTVMAQEEEAAWKTQQLSECLAADDIHRTDDSDDITFGIKGEKVTAQTVSLKCLSPFFLAFLSLSLLPCVCSKYRV